jgi:hypothetical protein
MAKTPALELLPPNQPEGHHNWNHAKVERKRIEIGKASYLDFINDSTVAECELRISCGSRGVNLARSTFVRCTFRVARELRNHGFTWMNLQDCSFFGKYQGCRFGSEFDDQPADIQRCDFSQVKLFQHCDFLKGADVDSMKMPPWPHVLVTDLPRSSKAWLRLKLPDTMRVVQKVIGETGLHQAASIYLPAETERPDDLRELLEKQSYIRIAEPPPANE